MKGKIKNIRMFMVLLFVFVLAFNLCGVFTVEAVTKDAVRLIREVTGELPENLPDKIVVGVSWNEKLHSMIQAWQDYMIQYSKEYGQENAVEFEWIINVADGDPARQHSNIEDLIVQDVDVIVARAQDAAAIGASIRAAQEASIPFLTFDRQSATMKPDAHVGANSYSQGLSTARALVEILKNNGIKGKAIEVMGDLRDINAVNRSKGWHEVEKETGAWETVIQVPTEWKPTKFKTGTTNALEAHPEANVMFLASDFCWSAVEEALKEDGRDVKSLLPPGLARERARSLHAKVSQPDPAKLAAGEELNGKNFLVPGRLATPDNIDELEYMWARDYED